VEVYINGALVTADALDVQEALAEARRHLPPRSGFTRVWVDGTECHDLASLSETQDTSPKRLDLEALSAEELAQQTAGTAMEYLERLLPYVEALSSALRVGDLGAFQKLEPLVTAFGYVEAAVRGIRAVDATREDESTAVAASVLRAHLEDVVASLERQDLVGAADILEYMTVPQLKALHDELRTRIEVSR